MRITATDSPIAVRWSMSMDEKPSAGIHESCSMTTQQHLTGVAEASDVALIFLSDALDGPIHGLTIWCLPCASGELFSCTW